MHPVGSLSLDIGLFIFYLSMFLFSCTNTTFQINQKDSRVPLLLFFTKYIQKILNTTEGGRSGVDNDNHVLCFHGTYRPMVVVVVVEDVDANVLCCCRGQCCISSIVCRARFCMFFCVLFRDLTEFFMVFGVLLCEVRSQRMFGLRVIN